MVLDLHEVSELIGGIVTIVTTVFGFLLSYHKTTVKRLKGDKDLACDDIAFMCALETKYIDHLKKHGVAMHPSIKVAMRELVREENGLDFSGKFTPGRVKASRTRRGLKPSFYRIKATLAAMGDRATTT